MTNTLLVGDIHGCYQELLDLIDRAGLGTGDEVISVGDFVDRGTQTPEVMAFFMVGSGGPAGVRAQAILGNHERKHLRGSWGEVPLALSQEISKKQLGEGYPAALTFLGGLSYYLELPEVVVVHGAYEPGVPLAGQNPAVLSSTRAGEAFLLRRFDRPWYELYDGNKPVVFGHKDIYGNGQPFVYQDQAYGLDTSCVHGRRLTGLLLPAFRLVSVPSRMNHWQIVRQENRPPKGARELQGNADWDEESEEALGEIISEAERENRRLMAHLLAAPVFETLKPRQQALAYAVLAEESVLMPLLHLARQGRLNRDNARRVLGSAEKARKLADNL